MSADCRVTFVLVAHEPEPVAQCLKRVAAYTTIPFRTIVVDGSADDGAVSVARPAGLDEGAAANLGVRHADTEFACVLNPEVEVGPGWLDPLIEFLDTHPRAASVAPAFSQDKDLFTTALDHVSTACLLIRRTAFHQAGGFSAEFGDDDPVFSKALRDLGWQLWLCPGSTVRYSQEVDYVRSADRVASFRVLLIDDRVPQVDRGRGDPRTMAVVDAWRAADELARITYFAALPERAEEYAPALRERGIEVVWGQDPIEWAQTRAGFYDVVSVFRPHNLDRAGEPIARYQPQAVRIYDSEALFHRRPEQFYETTSDPVEREEYAAEAKALRETETHAFQWADIGVCVSEDEAAWGRSVAPDTRIHVACYPTRMDRSVPGLEEREGIVFFGGFSATPGTPNEYAVLELANEVMPELRERHPSTHLRIVGADPSPAVLDLQSDHISVLGRVADPHPVLASALVHVVPMRYGAGVKAKFIDTMAAGLPFVTTPIGGEGLYLGELSKHLIGDTNAEIIELTHALLTDQTLWTDVQGRLLEICRKHFSPEAFAAEVDAVIADCGIPIAPS